MGLFFWLPLILPVIAVAFAYGFRKLKQDGVPVAAEAVMWAGPSLVILIITWFTVKACLTWDHEYWQGWATELRFTEDEWRLETYTETDSKGNVTTKTKWVYYPPHWSMLDDMGGFHPLRESTYLKVAAQWNIADPPTHRLFRGSGKTHYLKWNGDRNTGLPVTSRHRWSNRTLACHTVFNFRDLSKEEAEGLHEWPKIGDWWHAPMVLGLTGPEAAEADRALAVLNADLGASKQVRVHVLVFHGRDASVAELQREHWKGGKKNELNICLGLDDSGNVEWCRTFSWSESEDLKAEIASWPETGKPMDWAGFLAFVRSGVEAKWKRKDFKDFDYLTVDMPVWSVILVWSLTLLSIGGLTIGRCDFN